MHKYKSIHGFVPTSEVGSVGETGGHLAVGHDDVHNALLDEIHLGAEGPFLDDHVTRLDHLVPKLRHDVVHEVLVRVGKERHRRHQRTAVVVDHILHTRHKSVLSFE